MLRRILRTLLKPVMICLLVSIMACAPSKIIAPSTVVNCTWPIPPTLSTIAEKASVAETIQMLLQDKNYMIDYGLKVQSTKQCYDESLKK